MARAAARLSAKVPASSEAGTATCPPLPPRACRARSLTSSATKPASASASTGCATSWCPSWSAASILAYLPEGDREGAAKDIFHSFVIGVYFFPLLGGWLADRVFGKYRTVLWFSPDLLRRPCDAGLVRGPRYGFYTGLFLIALGSGGIKPLVVSSCGDQFDQTANKHLAKIVFDAFYWIINFGSFLRLAADALCSCCELRPGGGLRHPGRADVHRHPDFLAGPSASTCTWSRPPAVRTRIRFFNVARTALKAQRGGTGAARPAGRRLCRRGAGGGDADLLGAACMVRGQPAVGGRRISIS
jgi:hypothetical protein